MSNYLHKRHQNFGANELKLQYWDIPRNHKCRSFIIYIDATFQNSRASI